MTLPRLSSLALIATAAVLATGCVFAPPASFQKDISGDVAKMSEKAVATCGAGNVREVDAKSFTCK